MRIVTRSDFDGLACAVLLREVGIVDDMLFVHPKDVQDGVVPVTSNDILANVPYVPGCGMWFDHHSSEEERLGRTFSFKGDSRPAASAARVIYEYYGGHARFARLEQTGLIDAVDKADSAQFTLQEILNPTGWVLLSFLMDPRTGLGRYHDYRVSNYQLMEYMIEYCRSMAAEQILRLPDVQERVRRYFEQEGLFREMLRNHSRQDENVIVLDLRGLDEIKPGNRFTIYSMYPEANVSVRVLDGKGKQNIVFACGHSVLNRTCRTNIGALMLRYGGGGHGAVGTCQVPHADAEQVLEEIVAQLKGDEDGAAPLSREAVSAA
jgi:nanoRNase/pAp phosphatase (c-di-AMP/oligoRNAs hydrolase)